MDANVAFYGYNNETVMEVYDNELKIEWAYIGEGAYGDYNPSDPSDSPLLRFYAYEFDGSGWVEIEDASYCSQMPLQTSEDILRSALMLVFSRYKDALASGSSVKRVGEELSWMSPANFS